MRKIVLTEKEKVRLELYINFLYRDSSPCDSCDPRSRAECCGCASQTEWAKRVSKYNVDDLLKEQDIKDYVIYSVSALKIQHEITVLQEKLKRAQTEREYLLSKIDVKPSGKASFHCPDCDIDLAVPTEKCTKASRINGQVIWYYNCPICKQTHFSNDDETL